MAHQTQTLTFLPFRDYLVANVLLSTRPTLYFPSEKAFLVVGTFAASPLPPVIGHIIAFEFNGASGQIFPAQSMDRLVDIRQPHHIQMNNITLSPVAIPVHMGATAFILDQVLSLRLCSRGTRESAAVLRSEKLKFTSACISINCTILSNTHTSYILTSGVTNAMSQQLNLDIAFFL